MRNQSEPVDGSFWIDGDMMFRVASAGVGAEPDRLVKVRRPFALIGRARDADIVINDRDASARHTYLHLDHRGVFSVDLVTRTGTRINGDDSGVGWLRPGDAIEVAGHRIELLRVRLDGAPVTPPPCDADLLAETDRPGLAAVILEPHRPNESPWVLGSELVFLGWSVVCGIPVKDQAVARTHCALVRSAAGAFLVNLRGCQTWVEDRPVLGASVLRDGDLLTLGSTRFTVRVTQPSTTDDARVPDRLPGRDAASMREFADIPRDALPALDVNADLIPAEAQTALLAWMVGAIQEGQGEVLRRQGEFQLAMTQTLHQIQQDNAALFQGHLQRIEAIDRELAALRAEIERRNLNPRHPLPPFVEPLRIARPDPSAPPGPESRAPTTWLLERVTQLEEENRSAWKDLLSRISPPRKAR